MKGFLLLLHHYQSINNTCFRSSCLRLVPRWSIRATWHRHEGGARLAAACEWGAEQLQQSLTITVSGWGNGTVGRREARMMLSSSWYHQLKLVMTEVTKQHSVCSKMKLYLYWVNTDRYWLFFFFHFCSFTFFVVQFAQEHCHLAVFGFFYLVSLELKS